MTSFLPSMISSCQTDSHSMIKIFLRKLALNKQAGNKSSQVRNMSCQVRKKSSQEQVKSSQELFKSSQKQIKKIKE